MLIVGAGLAGLTVAETLRGEGYAGSITLLGAEAHAPLSASAAARDTPRMSPANRTSAEETKGHKASAQRLA